MSEALSEPLILISARIMAPLLPAVRRVGLDVELAWELAEADRPRVRVMLHAGEAKLTADELAAFPNLGLIANLTAGYEGVDVAWCRANGVAVTYAGGANADDVADHAMGLLITGWRDLHEQDRLVKEGRWRMEDRLLPQPTLTGARLGVLGMGFIGEAIARRAEAFRMRIAWWGPNPKPVPWPRAEGVLRLAEDSDILVIAARGGDDTRHLVSREVIDAVGPKGMIVNVGRGSVIDEDALIEALKAGRLRRAALDVFETEPTPAARWADVPGVFLTPHRAGGTTEGVPNMLARTVENIRAFLEGRPLLSPIP